MSGYSSSAIVNFVYHPEYRPMGTDMLSLVTLYAIRDLKSSTSEEIREKIKKDVGFDIRSDKFFDNKINSLWDVLVSVANVVP